MLSRLRGVPVFGCWESAQGFAHLVDGRPILRGMTEHRVDQLAQRTRSLHRSALAVRHGLSLDGARSVVRILHGSPPSGGDEERRAESVDVGFLCGFGLSGREHAARDLWSLVVDEAAAEREVVPLGYVPTPGKSEVDEVRPLRPDDEVGGLYVTVRPALGVEFGQRLDTAQGDAVPSPGVRRD